MPYSRPTLSQIRAETAADISSSVPGASGLLRFSNLGVIGDLLAKCRNALYGYLDWIARQSNPFTATGEYLEAWAALRSVYRKPATAAAGQAAFAATGAPTAPAGTPITRADGFVYVTTADAVAVAGVLACPILAITVGAAGNTAAGVPMSLGVAIAGVGATGATPSAITGGADVEDNDGLRTRMLAAYQSAAEGGAASDYVRWALAVPGVTRAWCRPNGLGAGTVVVYCMFDTAEAGFGGFPQGSDGVASAEPRAAAATGDQLAVANAILPLQPVTALVTSAAPKKNTVTLTVSLPGASTALKAQIAAAGAQVLLQKGSPGGALLANGQAGGVLQLSYLEAAFAGISGSAGFVITAIAGDHGTVTPGSAGNITSATGYLPVLGPITWT